MGQCCVERGYTARVQRAPAAAVAASSPTSEWWNWGGLPGKKTKVWCLNLRARVWELQGGGAAG